MQVLARHFKWYRLCLGGAMRPRQELPLPGRTFASGATQQLIAAVGNRGAPQGNRQGNIIALDKGPIQYLLFLFMFCQQYMSFLILDISYYL